MKNLSLVITLFLLTNFCNAQIKGYVITNESDTISVTFPKEETYYRFTEGKLNQGIKYNHENQSFHKKPNEIKGYMIELKDRYIFAGRDDNQMFFVSRINATNSESLKIILFPSYTYLGRKIIIMENTNRKVMIFKDFDDLKQQIADHVSDCDKAVKLISIMTEKSTFEDILNDVALVFHEYERCITK